MTNETNPVVLPSANTWHIVEHSRSVKIARCGHSLQDRRTHSRPKNHRQPVRAHVSNILSKLHLKNRTQAAVYAWREGVVRKE